MQIFWSVAAVLVGGVMMTGAVANSERFLRSGRIDLLVQAFGRGFTRGLYGFSGAGCVGLGVYLLLYSMP